VRQICNVKSTMAAAVAVVAMPAAGSYDEGCLNAVLL
jgi:hypothetical protein